MPDERFAVSQSWVNRSGSDFDINASLCKSNARTYTDYSLSRFLSISDVSLAIRTVKRRED